MESGPMSLFVFKANQSVRPRWQIVLLAIVFVLGVALTISHLLEMVHPFAFFVPAIVFATAFFTYWVMIDLIPKETDVTAGQKSELKKISRATEATVQDLFDELPIALMRLTRSGRIKQTNQFARTLLGLREGSKQRMADIVSGLTRPVPDWLEELDNRAARGEPKLVQVTGTKSEVFLHVSMISMDPKGGSDLIAVITDATELKTLEAQFVQSQKMQAIGQLAGGVAHDFNNLLTAISGYCDLLLLRHDEGDPDYSDLIQISHTANRAAALVGQLLAFSRKQTLQPKVLNVNDALADMTHLLNRLVGEKITLTLTHAENLPNIYADKRQLEQVIMNLVVNARDAMPAGGRVDIITSVAQYKEDFVKQNTRVPKGCYVQIKVQDTGSGIKPKDIPHIFDPFFTTKTVGEGTGLGLSTVYGIVKQTGGLIFVESQLGKGTIFSVLLPVTEHAETPPKDQDILLPQAQASVTGATVLLVEDEVPVRSFAARALKMQNMNVLEAESGEDALSLLKDPDLHVDIFVSDVIMPGIDGPTWVREALKSRPDVRVIFISGYAEEIFSKEFGEITGAKFLSKPFTLPKLIQTVHDLYS